MSTNDGRQKKQPVEVNSRIRTTRLQVFVTANQIRSSTLAREAGISRRHLLDIRKGIAEPTRNVMTELARACSRLVRRPVSASDLFDLREKR
jgi:hypothetical protein